MIRPTSSRRRTREVAPVRRCIFNSIIHTYGMLPETKQPLRRLESIQTDNRDRGELRTSQSSFLRHSQKVPDMKLIL